MGCKQCKDIFVKNITKFLSVYRNRDGTSPPDSSGDNTVGSLCDRGVAHGNTAKVVCESEARREHQWDSPVRIPSQIRDTVHAQVRRCVVKR